MHFRAPDMMLFFGAECKILLSSQNMAGIQTLYPIWYIHRVPNWVHKSCSKLGFVCGMDGSWVNENLVPNWVQYLSSKFGEQLLYLIGCTICVPNWVLNLCAKLSTSIFDIKFDFESLLPLELL